MNHWFSLLTPVGILRAEDDGTNITAVVFGEKQIVSSVTDLQKETEKQFREYFEGKRKVFDLPLKLCGSDFQIRVWNALRKIPYGKTVSYQEIAEKTGNEKAYRAVGTAVHNNPLPVIIPCHRVIRKDGTAGGYAGGLERKIILLNLEKEHA